MKIRPLLPLLLLANIVACVTINIYFPAAAVEKAADEIIRDIQKSPSESNQSRSELNFASYTLSVWNLDLTLGRVFGLWISSAYAQADLNIDSPATPFP